MGQDTNKTHGNNKTRERTPIKHMAVTKQDRTPIKHLVTKHRTGH